MRNILIYKVFFVYLTFDVNQSMITISEESAAFGEEIGSALRVAQAASSAQGARVAASREARWERRCPECVVESGLWYSDK